MSSAAVKPRVFSQAGFSRRNTPSTPAMQSMSEDVSKRVASSASARLRSTNWPTWLPIVASISRSSSSGRAISRLKNSSTPRTCSPSTMGVPRAPRRPSWLATRARGKLSSLPTSGMNAGRRLSHTLPGRPDARSEGEAAARLLERGECQAGPLPRLHAAQDARRFVDPPQPAVVPAERLADRLQDAGGRLPERCRLGEGARRLVLRVEAADRLVLRQGGRQLRTPGWGLPGV